jgi:hypothetical protein
MVTNAMTDKQPPTHGAYALRRESRLRSRWIEIGYARIEGASNGVHHVFLDRLPVGGFTGHVTLSPIGKKPPDPEPQPERPSEQSEI